MLHLALTHASLAALIVALAQQQQGPPPDGPPGAQDGEPEGPPPFLSPAEWDPTTPRGLLLNAPGAFDGLTFISPVNSTRAHLVDLDGSIVHTWQFDSAPGEWAYLLDDGTLMRAGREDTEPRFSGGGIGGKLQRVAPDGTVLWNFDLASDALCQHHDIEVLPNGHVLVIAWERIDAIAAIAGGRDPAWVGGAGLWPDTVVELEPIGTSDARVVWQWRAWDHVIQDFDANMANFGDVTAHPELIDINADHRSRAPMSPAQRRQFEAQQAQLAALGYTGGVAQSAPDESEEDLAKRRERLAKSGDVFHVNGIDYNAEHDLIVLSSPEFCELWVIDHSTTIEEARGSHGGKRGHGGDLLWRWGNPKNYGHGSVADHQLDYQHDPKWLPTTDGTLRLTVFDNGGGRSERSASEVEELILPFDAKLGFEREEGEPFGPEKSAWHYSDEGQFYSAFISGAERLPNGNTLICSGAGGRVFEVTRDGATVWNYRSDLGGDVAAPDHAGKAPDQALFRAARYARTHPGIVTVLASH